MASKKIISVIPGSLSRFTKNAAFSGIILIFVALVAIIWANSAAGNIYFELWQNKITIGFGSAIISKPLLLWINDGLMAMFFFVIGLEIKREVIAGELSSWKKAAMAVYAALGGMIIPSLIFIFFNHGKTSSNGWGIPMATDIAFSLGILALLGKRVPLSLKIFLTALAIVDDLGAVLVIAFFYSSKIILSNVALGGLFLGLMIAMNLAGVRNKLAYAIPGILGIWLAFLLSGVHATIAGVLAAFAIPASTKINKTEFKQTILNLANGINDFVKKNNPFLNKEEQQVVTAIKETCEHYEPPLQSLENSMHPWVIFLIMPVFALSNTGVLLGNDVLPVIKSAAGMGIVLGLVLGKPLGILLFSWLAYKMGVASLPENIKWVHILGVGLLAGIGFTMALFVASLAFTETALISSAKISILFASLIAGIAGYFILRKTLYTN
jgi:NhaA family Na+:H+ antiporter